MKTIGSTSKWSLVILFVIISFTAGCSGGGEGSSSPPPPNVGSVTGTLTVSNVILPALASVATQSNTTEPDIVPGEIIVRFKDGLNDITAIASLLSKYKDIGLVNAGPIYPNGPYLFRTNAYQNTKISTDEAKRQTQDAILKLKSEPNIKYAEPNNIAQPQMMPSNPAFLAGFQWDMSMLNLPTAWELTTGSSSVIVAVLDSGIRSHPNLDPNVLSTGYDFVDNDSDPTEPLYPNAEFHGTHVAGTIAAIGGSTGDGIAGVAWNVKIMPVRVLGALGGTDIEIQNGMLYAAGLPNSSGKVPPQRANVINMSLAGVGSCSQAYQDVINQVINAGVTVVVAAGNNYGSGNPITSPASCQGVIAVGAVDPVGNRASYSESQPYITVVAPGGEEWEGIHAGVLSTFPVSSAGGPYYKFMQGTSMATPHVSGIVALMHSVNPSLTPAQVLNILAYTANPLNTTVPNNDVGYGLVDAGKAVEQAAGVQVSVPVPYPSPSLFNFQQIPGPVYSTGATILNLGGSTLSISSAIAFGIYDSAGAPVGGTRLSASLDPSCFAIVPSYSCPITYTVDPTGLPDGEYYSFVVVNSNGGNFAIPILFQVGSSTAPTISGPVTVQLWSVDPSGGLFGPVATTLTDAGQHYNYTFQSVLPGQYVVVAGADMNANGVFGDFPGEIYTISGIQKITVIAGQTANADLQIGNEPDDILDGI